LTKYLLIGLVALIGLRILSVVLKRLFRSFMVKQFGVAIGKTALAKTPATISLLPAGVNELEDDDRLTLWAEELLDAGYVNAGLYTVPEMPGLSLRLMIHPADGFAAALYRHPQTDPWCDVVVRYADKTSSTWCNRPPTGLDERPGWDRICLPDASIPGLHAAARKGLQHKPRNPFEKHTVARDFVQAYAEEMEWRKTKGIRTEEVARMAANMK